MYRCLVYTSVFACVSVCNFYLYFNFLAWRAERAPRALHRLTAAATGRGRRWLVRATSFRSVNSQFAQHTPMKLYARSHVPDVPGGGLRGGDESHCRRTVSAYAVHGNHLAAALWERIRPGDDREQRFMCDELHIKRATKSVSCRA